MDGFLEIGKTYWIPLEQISTGQYGLRDTVGGQPLDELKKSMTERGQLMPILVTQRLNDQSRLSPPSRLKLRV